MAKTVLITGASSGIGKATARIFADAGWNVAATMRKPNVEVFRSTINVSVHTLDVTDNNTVKQAFEEVVAKYGKIDVVINNAGYSLEGVFEATDEVAVQKQFDTNVLGLMRVTRAAIPIMRRQGHGTIIQIASMGGRITFPLYSIYHASKWAVEGFSESLHYELKKFGIRIKIIEPGVINTNFYLSGRKLVKPAAELGYGEFSNNIEKTATRSGARGESPEKVAGVIYRAATSTSTKLRYSVGWPAPLLLTLRKILPERLFFYLIRKRFKI